MKAIDVVPCDHETRESISFPEIPVFHRDLKLREEIDRGGLTEEFAKRLLLGMYYQRAFEFTVRDLENKSLVPSEGCRRTTRSSSLGTSKRPGRSPRRW